MTFNDEVSYFARISGPRSIMRCNIVGTTTRVDARCSAIPRSVSSGLNLRLRMTVLPSAAMPMVN